jgi:4-amino-4-deoxy-L-arabinose transferase-like glycosyltransferase
VPAIWRARREPAAQFLLAWLVPSWIVFELVITKLPHYVLPLYPAIAILICGAIELKVLSRRPWIVRGLSWWFTAPAVIGVLAVVGAIYLTHQPVFAAWPFAAAATIFGLFAWWLYDDNNAERSLLNAVTAAFFLYASVLGIILPSLTPLFPAVELGKVLRSVECAQPRAAVVGYEEPSLIFMLGTRTLPADPSRAADFLAEGGCRFALVDYRSERAFAQRAEAIGLRYILKTRVEGYNYSLGKPVSVAVFTSEGVQ